METERKSIGKAGEGLASMFLEKHGYCVLTRNYRRPWGEIDIVCRAKDGTLVFVEVKALSCRGGSCLMPEDHLTEAKLMKLQRACAAFARRNPKLIRNDKGWRIDLVAVEFKDSEEPEIRHYENI